MNEKQRLQEDLDILYDDIEYYNELLRRHEHFGEPFPEESDDVDSVESHLNSLENEAAYLERCLEDV